MDKAMNCTGLDFGIPCRSPQRIRIERRLIAFVIENNRFAIFRGGLL